MTSIWNERTLGPDSILLEDRVAIVTGGAQGIGRATALAMARFGADIAICDRKADELEATASEIRRMGRRCVSAVADVREEAPVSEFLSAVDGELGSVGILVNNAGGGFWSPFFGVNAKGENALVRENFGSVTLFIRGTVPLMRDGGSIVNVTSVEAHRAGPGFAIYSAMKAGVTNLTKSLSMELAPLGIRINCIAPDMIPTPGDEVLGDDSQAVGLPGIADTSWPETGASEDCAAACVFLASDMARFVTGSTIHVDGGTWAAGGWKRKTDGGFTL